MFSQLGLPRSYGSCMFRSWGTVPAAFPGSAVV